MRRVPGPTRLSGDYEFVIMVVVGGIETVSGALVGAVLVTVISQVLTSLGTSASLPAQLPTVLSLGV